MVRANPAPGAPTLSLPSKAERFSNGTKQFLCQESFYIHLQNSIFCRADSAFQRSTFFEKEEVNKKGEYVWGSSFSPAGGKCLNIWVPGNQNSISCSPRCGTLAWGSCCSCCSDSSPERVWL